MTILKQIGLTALIVGMFLAALITIEIFRAHPADASVSRFAEYQATTTASQFPFSAETLVQTGAGTLGSIVITGATTGIINIYDATTSDITRRTNNTATSSILRASIPASTAAGTYTFDVLLTNGLYLTVSGTAPTSTITYRAN